MIVTVVFFTIIALAFLMIGGTVLYGIALAIAGWIGSLVETAQTSLSRSSRPTPPLPAGTARDRAVVGSDPAPGQLPAFSADDMWAQMQGRRPPRKLRAGRRSRGAP